MRRRIKVALLPLVQLDGYEAHATSAVVYVSVGLAVVVHIIIHHKLMPRLML